MYLAPLLAFGLMSSAMTLTVALVLTGRLRLPDVGGLTTLLVLSAGTWLLSNGPPFEGRVLLSVTQNHGLVSTDLFALAPLAVAAWLLARTFDQERRDREDQ